MDYGIRLFWFRQKAPQAPTICRMTAGGSGRAKRSDLLMLLRVQQARARKPPASPREGVTYSLDG